MHIIAKKYDKCDRDSLQYKMQWNIYNKFGKDFDIKKKKFSAKNDVILVGLQTGHAEWFWQARDNLKRK